MTHRILIAASGTGGHLMPALLIAKEFIAEDPSATVEFIGSGRPLEEKIIDKNGFKRHVLSLAGVKNLGMAGAFKFLLSILSGFIGTWKLFSSFKPDAVIGVGGYVSVMPALVAKLRGIPVWVHEAEIHPGLANWFLSLFANVVSTAFSTAKMPIWAKTKYTGHPVRTEVTKVDRETVRDQAPQHLLVLGGSQGAKALDRTVPKFGELLSSQKILVRHQCRPENVDEVKSAYNASGITAEVLSFIDDMAGAYDWADIIVSRAGANSVLEISIVNRPAIFVPYPYQQGNHQTENAQTLAVQGKAKIVEEGAGFEERFGKALSDLLKRDNFIAMKQASNEGRAVDAASRIVQGVKELI